MIPAGPNLCDILPSAAAVLGVPAGDDRLDLRSHLGDRRRVVVLLIDGMGLELLPRLAPHAPFLASVLAGTTGRLDALQCTFPSTTPTSLVSFSTGVRPGEHGVLGFTVHVPGTARVLTHIFWKGDPDPRAWQPVPTWFEQVSDAGLDAAVVQPAGFEDSGLTGAAYRGARFCGLVDDAGAVGNADRVLLEARTGRGLVFGYTAVLDTAAHRAGIASPQWARAATEVDEFVRRVADGLPSDAALLITADHGGLDVGAAGRIDLDADPALARGVRIVAGEPRVRYLHTVPGAADDVAATWRKSLGERALVLTRDEAIGAGWFGPVRPGHAERIGDVVVVCRQDTVVLATGHEPPELAELVGFHGSDSRVESAIPLITLAS